MLLPNGVDVSLVNSQTLRLYDAEQPYCAICGAAYEELLSNKLSITVVKHTQRSNRTLVSSVFRVLRLGLQVQVLFVRRVEISV